uniref:Solute carrier family 2, facilitated glucose transporter member 4 n=1 Tax=Lepeophtheirus salmonis TaxID=72036 RepID=C1BSA3_LEPSM|nr:Solute carrier family 2, facilitated glucose transporter member 4 [Lepeophtheirus salmonis]
MDKNNRSLFLVIFTAVLGMFQFGWNTGVFNMPEKYIEHFISTVENGNTSTLFIVANAAFILGGMIGGLGAGTVAEKVGRQKGLLFNQILVFLGVVLMSISKDISSYPSLVIGRLFMGGACGLFTGLVPLYVNEVAPINLRGGLGTVNQLAVTCGLLLAQILGQKEILGGSSWPILLSLSIIPAIIQSILLPFCPESPRYMAITKNDKERSLKALRKLRGTHDVEDEYNSIVSEGSNSDSLSIKQVITASELRKPLTIAILMHLSQQITGIVGIFFYSSKIFRRAGISEESSSYATVGAGSVMVVMTLITIPLMDKSGRRPLHLIGMAGMTVACVLTTIAFFVAGDTTTISGGATAFLIISTLTFVVFFALGPGSIPWLITGELFATESRPAASSIATTVNWTASLIVTLVFPIIPAKKLTFVPFGIILVILFIPLYILLPETKNRTIEEILVLLNKNRKPKESGGTHTSAYAQDIQDI